MLYSGNILKSEVSDNSSSIAGIIYIATFYRAAQAASKFGLMEVLQELGKKSKKNQEGAIKKKELNRLYPTNLIFLEGSMKALMSSYIELNYSMSFEPTVEGFVNFCLESKNHKTRALFLAQYHFGMPPVVNRIIRMKLFFR